MKIVKYFLAANLKAFQSLPKVCKQQRRPWGGVAAKYKK